MIVGLQEWKYSEAAVEIDVTTGAKSRKADIGVHCSEGPFCSLSFDFERYSPQAYHLDGKAF